MIRKLTNILLALLVFTSTLLPIANVDLLLAEADAAGSSSWNFSYTGSVQTFIAPATGTYKLEVWGAQGGNDGQSIGGYGGYSNGEISLSAGQKLYIYVGGQGQNSGAGAKGGWNGGANGGSSNQLAYGSAGGGATDIRYSSAGNLYQRIIVAGGGGGADANDYTMGSYSINGQPQRGGDGGGLKATVGNQGYNRNKAIDNGYATQSSGYAFGYGQPGGSNAAGGGGGWYGGKSGDTAVSDSSGGSGYVLTASSYKPSGYNPDTQYYLNNANTSVGNQSFPAPSGGTETGHSGNGYARITQLAASPVVNLVDITVTPNTVNLNTAATQQLSVTADMSDNSTEDITGTATYTSNNTGVATVNSSGLVTAVGSGTANITVTYQGQTATVPVTVTNPATLSSITATPATLELLKGGTQQLAVTANMSDGSSRDVTASATFAVDQAAIATVSGTGLITGVTTGSADVTVTYQGQTVTVPVTVYETISTSQTGDYIVLRVPQNLNPVTYNCAAGFTVTQDGINDPVTKVVVVAGTDGWPYSEITLSMQNPVVVGSDVSVAYNADPNYPITPVSGTQTVTIPTGTVINQSTAPVTLGGVTVSGSGTVVHVNLPTAIQSYDYANSAGFTIYDGTTPITVTRVVTGGTGADLYVANPIPAGDTISIGYQPAGQYPIETISGTSLTATTQPVAVVNQSTSPVVISTNPVVSTDGTTITLTAPVNLTDISYYDNAGFRVYANGQQIPVLSVQVEGDKIILTLGAPIIGDATYSYTADPGEPITSTGGTPVGSISTGSLSTTATLTGISVQSGSSLTLTVGSTQQLTVTGTYSDGSSSPISGATYTSSNPSVVTVDSNGLVTAVGPGTATITITYEGQTYTITVTVNAGAPQVSSLSATPNPVTMNVGGTQQLAVTATMSDGSTQDVTADAGYQSAGIRVASISSGGLISGATAGTTDVTVTYQGQTVTVPVTVKALPPTLVSISATPNPVSVTAGKTQQLTVTATMSDGSTQTITSQASYQVDNGSVASVNSGLVSGLTQGTANVTVTYQGQSVTVPVTVTAPTVVSLTATPNPVTVAPNGTQQFTVTAKYSDGSSKDVTSLVTYTPANSNVATVSGTGLLTGYNTGSQPATTSVAISYGGQSVTVPVTVNGVPATPTGLVVNPNPVVTTTLSPVNLQVIEKYSNGSQIDVTTQSSYQSADTGIATVNMFGQVVGKTPGTTTVTVTYQGQTITVPVTINPVNVVSPTRGSSTPTVNNPTRTDSQPAVNDQSRSSGSYTIDYAQR